MEVIVEELPAVLSEDTTFVSVQTLVSCRLSQVAPLVLTCRSRQRFLENITWLLGPGACKGFSAFTAKNL